MELMEDKIAKSKANKGNLVMNLLLAKVKMCDEGSCEETFLGVLTPDNKEAVVDQVLK